MVRRAPLVDLDSEARGARGRAGEAHVERGGPGDLAAGERERRRRLKPIKAACGRSGRPGAILGEAIERRFEFGGGEPLASQEHPARARGIVHVGQGVAVDEDQVAGAGSSGVRVRGVR
jgi:hypothetical protein